jgi:AraC-like DNA-binding protein
MEGTSHVVSSNSHILTGNQILFALPRQQYPLLFSSLQSVHLDRGQILYDLADPIRSAFFIVSGMVSLLATTGDGSMTQVGMVGDEGVVGIPAVLRINKAPYQVTVQIPGRAMRVRTEVLVNEFSRDGPLQDILLRYVHSLICQVSESAACNRFSHRGTKALPLVAGEPRPREVRQAAAHSGSTVTLDLRIQRVIAFMEERSDRELSLAGMARVARLSPSRLRHKFKSEVGVTPTVYLQTLRMRMARELLTTNHLTVKEVKAAVGISSDSYFTHQFKRAFGMPPSHS